jgi:hypothetical protein
VMEREIKIIAITAEWVTVEYEEDGYLERKLVPWRAFPVSVKGAARISAEVLAMGMDYSNVYLEDRLGDELPPIRVRDLQDALRRAGLWQREDYRDNPRIVAGIVQRLRGTDAARIINAALSKPEESKE